MARVAAVDELQSSKIEQLTKINTIINDNLITVKINSNKIIERWKFEVIDKR